MSPRYSGSTSKVSPSRLATFTPSPGLKAELPRAAQTSPRTIYALQSCDGVGARTAERYGDAILEIIATAS